MSRLAFSERGTGKSNKKNDENTVKVQISFIKKANLSTTQNTFSELFLKKLTMVMISRNTREQSRNNSLKVTKSRLCKFFGAIICLLLLLEFSFIRQTSEDVAQMPDAMEILSNAHETVQKELREERKSFLEEQERKQESLKKQLKKQQKESFTSSVGIFGEKIPK